METKKNKLSNGLLNSLAGNTPFSWYHLEAVGSAGGILIDANSDIFTMTVNDVLKYCVSAMLTCGKTSFS